MALRGLTRQLKLLVGFASLWLGWSISACGEVVVVVSQQSPVSTLTRTQLANIFLGKPNQLADGKRAVPIDQIDGRSLRETFYRDMLGKSTAEIKAHWSRIVFTGRGQPPKQVAGDQEVKKLLQDNANAIGYIDASNRGGELKVVSITP